MLSVSTYYKTARKNRARRKENRPPRGSGAIRPPAPRWVSKPRALPGVALGFIPSALQAEEQRSTCLEIAPMMLQSPLAVPSLTADASSLWPQTKWNIQDAEGAYARPYSSAYNASFAFEVPGTAYDASDVKEFNTRLDIEADLSDPGAQASGIIVADLADPNTESLEVTLTHTPTLHIPPSPAKNPITRVPTVTGSGGGGAHVKMSLASTDAALLDEGTWRIELRHVRDGIGNFYDDDSTVAGVQPKTWAIRLK